MNSTEKMNVVRNVIITIVDIVISLITTFKKTNSDDGVCDNDSNMSNPA